MLCSIDSDVLVKTVNVYIKEYSFYSTVQWQDNDAIYAAKYYNVVQHDPLTDSWKGTKRTNLMEDPSKAEPLSFYELDFYKKVIGKLPNKERTHDMYDANTYQKDAMRTCSIPRDDYGAMLAHAVFGLCSEAGEVAGIFQKQYQGHEVDPLHLKKELGDCLWMIAEACTAAGFELADVMHENIQKLEKRYPDGFDKEHSLHRAKGDI